MPSQGLCTRAEARNGVFYRFGRFWPKVEDSCNTPKIAISRYSGCLLRDFRVERITQLHVSDHKKRARATVAIITIITVGRGGGRPEVGWSLAAGGWLVSPARDPPTPSNYAKKSTFSLNETLGKME